MAKERKILFHKIFKNLYCGLLKIIVAFKKKMHMHQQILNNNPPLGWNKQKKMVTLLIIYLYLSNFIFVSSLTDCDEPYQRLM